ncbi:MAG: hypothetical protein LBG60_04170 [Bifidobacteriaceae bacterium]|jgi:hypothetical protein|nr:hypothetical protein [Bifidobacteriaceae bacterium]
MATVRKTLGRADSPHIVSLMRLIETQSKATLVNWCLDYAEANLWPIYARRQPDDDRPSQALRAARAWLAGEIKLPAAKRAILDQCHAAARSLDHDPAAQAAARAIGQAASSIHAPTHCLGMAFYGPAAIAYDGLGTGQRPEVYDAVAAQECAKMEAALRAVAVPDEPNPAKVNWRC